MSRVKKSLFFLFALVSLPILPSAPPPQSTPPLFECTSQKQDKKFTGDDKRRVGTRREDGGSLLVLVPGVLRVPDTADLERNGTPRERLERGQMAEGGHPER